MGRFFGVQLWQEQQSVARSVSLITSSAESIGTLDQSLGSIVAEVRDDLEQKILSVFDFSDEQDFAHAQSGMPCDSSINWEFELSLRCERLQENVTERDYLRRPWGYLRGIRRLIER